MDEPVLNYLVPLRFAELAENNDLVWIEALEAKTYHTPMYGKIDVTPEKLNRFADNFHKNVRGIELATDYDHGLDPAKGKKASGWIKDVQVKDNKLVYGVKLTDTAKAEIEAGEWKYFSADWLDKYQHEDGTEHNDVLLGGGFTNRPVAKSLMPINFSEVMIEVDDGTKFAVWSTAYKNNLPDSAFLWIESGGKKDSEGKTVPRSLRHLPVRDANGKIDAVHVRDAISRAPQIKGISSAMASALQNKARRLLGAHSMSEAGLVTQEYVDTIVAVDPAEFMEPGSGNIDYGVGTPHDDSDGRIDTPPPGEDGSVPDRSQTVENKGGEMDDFEKQLRDSLGVADDVDVTKYITDGLTKLENLEATAKEFSERKAFAEQYPDEHKRMQELEDANRELKARQFSEALASKRVTRSEGETEVPTNLGLSSLALEKAGELHKKFSEGIATVADFEEFLNTTFSDGIVEYGERGSTQAAEANDDTVPANGNVTDIRKAFSEKVDALANDDEHKDKDYGTRVAIAAAQNPKLYEAYLNAKSA